MMINSPKQKFLFRCDDCELILSAEFEEEEDLENLANDKIELECPCGSKCKILRD